MTLYLEEQGTFHPWDGREKIGGITYQPNIGDLWSEQELARLGLYEPVVPEVPVGKTVASKSVQRVNGVVTWVYVLDDGPFSPLNRIQFEFMVAKLNLGTAIDAAIEAMPEGTDLEQNTKIMARVLRQHGQTFERSHPLFTELAPAVGVTAEQIDAMWAQALTI